MAAASLDPATAAAAETTPLVMHLATLPVDTEVIFDGAAMLCRVTVANVKACGIVCHSASCFPDTVHEGDRGGYGGGGYGGGGGGYPAAAPMRDGTFCDFVASDVPLLGRLSRE